MRVHAIINPIAGGGYASEIYRSILDQFREFDLTYDITSAPGDATKIAERAREGKVEYILCIGGDGTLNEVVQSLAHSDTILIPVSAGTGSDFVKTLGLKDMANVKESIRENSHRSVDLGRVESGNVTRYFLNILEIGFGASVMKRVNSRKKVRGGGSFTSSVLALLPFFKPYSVDMKLMGETHSFDLAEMVVANGRYFGGGMLAAPGAELDDGLLDVHIVRGVGRLQMVSRLRKLKDGSYVRDPSVRSYRTGEIEIRGSAPVEMDGEDFGNLPVKVSVEKGSLRVLSPVVQK